MGRALKHAASRGRSADQSPRAPRAKSAPLQCAHEPRSANGAGTQRRKSVVEARPARFGGGKRAQIDAHAQRIAYLQQRALPACSAQSWRVGRRAGGTQRGPPRVRSGAHAALTHVHCAPRTLKPSYSSDPAALNLRARVTSVAHTGCARESWKAPRRIRSAERATQSAQRHNRSPESKPHR